MRKSGRVRLSDLRRAYRLIHDCRDVGHDVKAWKTVLVEGLTRLVEAQVAAAGEIGAETPGQPPRLVQTADCGWLEPVHRENWDRHYTRGQKFRGLPTFQRFQELQSALTTRSREQLVSDSDWYRSDEFNVFHRSMGVDDILASAARSHDPPGLLGFTIFRALDQKRFGAWERRLVRLFHRELTGHVGTSLARAQASPPRLLPPRLQETLDCLREGCSEKQAARRLGISPHTVHQYVKALYRHLDVCSRAELMALCLRGDARVDPRPPRPSTG
jgi:DNA-binding CsgD family transcriptional regulator